MSLPIKDRAKQFYITTTLIGLTYFIGKNLKFFVVWLLFCFRLVRVFG